MSRLLIAAGIIAGACILHKHFFGRYPWEPLRLTPIRPRVVQRTAPARLIEDSERGQALTPSWRMYHGAYGSIKPEQTTGTFA